MSSEANRRTTIRSHVVPAANDRGTYRAATWRTDLRTAMQMLDISHAVVAAVLGCSRERITQTLDEDRAEPREITLSQLEQLRAHPATAELWSTFMKTYLFTEFVVTRAPQPESEIDDAKIFSILGHLANAERAVLAMRNAGHEQLSFIIRDGELAASGIGEVVWSARKRMRRGR